MSGSGETKISQLQAGSDLDSIPKDISFFQPYLPYYVKQTLEIGGEAYVSKTKEGVSGLFIWDDYEKTGTIFTRSREAFDQFYRLKQPFDYLFAEFKTERKSEAYDIYTINLADFSVDHKFRHEISVGEKEDLDELGRFMVLTHPGMNRKWVGVALNDGEKCFTVKLKDEIAGVGWVSLVNGIGSLHSLYVKSQYRKMGIGEDVLNARLLWLKTKRARSAFSEIEQTNHSSAKVSLKAGMKASGLIHQYFEA